MVAAGAAEDYGGGVQAGLVTSLATLLGVPSSDVSLSVTAASVALVFQVTTSTAASAETLAAAARSRTAAQMSTDLGISVVSSTTATVIAPPPSSAVPAPPNAIFQVVSGNEFCHVSVTTGCVDDGEGEHLNNELCYVRAVVNLRVTATFFDTEANYDYVEFGPTMDSGPRTNRFSGNVGPVDYPMPAGMIMKWHSDGSVNNHGFVICGTPAPDPPSSPPPPARPPPPFPVQARADGETNGELVGGLVAMAGLTAFGIATSLIAAATKED